MNALKPNGAYWTFSRTAKQKYSVFIEHLNMTLLQVILVLHLVETGASDVSDLCVHDVPSL